MNNQYPVNNKYCMNNVGFNQTYEQTVMEGINKTLANQEGTFQQMMKQFDEVHRHIANDKMLRKRSKTDYELLFYEDRVGLVIHYDYGEPKFVAFMEGLDKDYKIYNLKIKGQENTTLFVIEARERIIVGDVEKRDGMNLMKYFKEGGVKFSSTIAKNIISRVLEDNFMEKIANCEDVFYIDILAGWNHSKKYIDADKAYKWGNRMNKIIYPVKNKRLAKEIGTELFTYYFSELKRFRNLRYRMIVFLYPYIAIMNSLLCNKANLRFDMCLNIVALESINKKNIENWLQILNRDHLDIICSDIKEKKLKELLLYTKDETLLVDTTTSEYENNYAKNKKLKLAYRIANVATGKENMSGVDFDEVYCNPVILSSDKLVGSNILNVFIESTLFSRQEIYPTDKDIFGGVFTSFIKYVENNFENVIDVLTKNIKIEGREKVVNVVYEVVEKFFNAKGFDVCKELKISNNVNFYNYFNNTCEYSMDELVDSFILLIRQYAKEYGIINYETNKTTEDDALYVEGDYLLISTKILEHILNKNAMMRYKRDILYKLKDLGVLVLNNQGGLCIKKQMHEDRRFYYKIEKKLFNKMGMVSIESLGSKGEK